MVNKIGHSYLRFLRILILGFIASFLVWGCNINANNKAAEEDWPADVDSAVEKIPPDKLEEYKKGVDSFYKNVLLRSGFNGGVIVAKYGQIIFNEQNGFFDLRHNNVPLTDSSAFHLASVSKTFTAMGVLKLVEKGLINLDDSIQKFFPQFPYEGITIRTLLNHRSGLPDYAHVMIKKDAPNGIYITNQDMLDYFIRKKPGLTSRPNTRFHYSNTNFALLALIIEKVSGKRYGDYLKQTFFKPLHMRDTYVFDIQKDSSTAMPSFDYRGRIEAFTPYDVIYGDKNVYCSTRDLLKWDQALYNPNMFPKELLDEAYTPYSNERAGIRNYGLGWRMNIYPDGKKIIYHNGWWHGNNTAFIRDIEDSVTIIVLGNKFDKTIYQSKKMLNVFEADRTIVDEE